MMNSPNQLKLYSQLSRAGRPKSYKGKIMLVAFLGTHIPLLSLFFFFVSSAQLPFGVAVRVMLVALLATLAGTAATLLALHQLLGPISLTSKALRDYLGKNSLPSLPSEFVDEAGTLMADTAHTIHKLDEVIHYISNYDDLTRLPNRTLFCHHLEQTLLEAQRTQESFALMLLDLNGFSSVNDDLGMTAGNQVLQSVAQRLQECLSEHDFLSRVGGDEFAVIHSLPHSVEDAAELAQKIHSLFTAPFHLDGDEVHLSARLGVALYPSDAGGMDHLLKNAEAAVSQARAQGRSGIQFYSAEVNEQLKRRRALENELRSALNRDELFLHYQPRIDVPTGRMVSVEALIRWNNPNRGLVSPLDFIPLAEETGLIVPIGEWVLRTACFQHRAWREAGLSPFKISVNLSAVQLKQPDLDAKVAAILEETGMNPHCLELEITESLLMENVQETMPLLGRLRGLGVSIALDDFGTGYSSMSYLKRFPIDTIKIDRTFVKDIDTDGDDAAIIGAIISLAHGLRLNVVAEGVETREHLNFLKARACDEVQGFYFSRPVSAEEIDGFLNQTSKELAVAA